MSNLCCIGLLFFGGFCLSVTLDKEQADWTLLASAVPSSCLKGDLYSRFEDFPFFFFLLYPTVPNINSYFIPGSFTIFYDKG